MSARRQRRPQPRKGPRAAIAPTVTKALVIVVGVPPALVGQVEGWVETALAKPVRVIPIAASPNDNRPYRTTQIDQILSNVVAYAQRKRRAEQQPAPASILLLYVPGLDQEPLLTAFDFFVFPVPLATLSAFHEGRQLRHDPEEVCRAIDSVLTPGSAVMQTFDAVQQRVTALVDSEALQLPPINFHVARDRPIAEVFRAIRRGDQAWDAAVDGLVVQEFDKARIPHLHKGANRRAYQDGRGLVFLAAHPSPATAPTARHPTTRTWRRPPATCYAVRSGSAAPSARASITMYSLRVTGGSTRSSFSAPERGPDDPSIPTSTSTPTMLCGGKNWPLPRYLGLRPPDLITRDYPH